MYMYKSKLINFICLSVNQLETSGMVGNENYVVATCTCKGTLYTVCRTINLSELPYLSTVTS